MKLSLGIDFGTSGARAIAIDNESNIHWSDGLPLIVQDQAPDQIWQQALWQLIYQIPVALKQRINRIAINGTSSTVLICDAIGRPVAEPLLYNDQRGTTVLSQVREIAPPGHSVIGATSSLTKLLWFSQHPNFKDARYFLHQADWLGFLLHGQLGISDYHNALKLGYDVADLCYPDWLMATPFTSLLPQVLAPGEPIGIIQPEVAEQLNLPKDCLVCAGTTDSIAAFAAAGANTLGQAVTSLGSTLVLKLLSDQPIDNAQYGIYSHRWGDLWLVGGASNTGGAVLRHFFTDLELLTLSQSINPQQPSPLDYYPLVNVGERFPVNDPQWLPRLTPRPTKDEDFLHGLLAGIAQIEAQGYQLLHQLGAHHLTAVYTAGGGAKNLIWQQIRHQKLGVPMLTALHQEAAYGTALIAQQGITAVREQPK